MLKGIVGRKEWQSKHLRTGLVADDQPPVPDAGLTVRHQLPGEYARIVAGRGRISELGPLRIREAAGSILDTEEISRHRFILRRRSKDNTRTPRL
jgi:hypothetical protein